jgi:hypothetical protein
MTLIRKFCLKIGPLPSVAVKVGVHFVQTYIPRAHHPKSTAPLVHQSLEFMIQLMNLSVMLS